jgi:hypothetical protein
MDVVPPRGLIVLVDKLGHPHRDVDAVMLLLVFGLGGADLIVILGLLEVPGLSHHADVVVSVV